MLRSLANNLDLLTGVRRLSSTWKQLGNAKFGQGALVSALNVDWNTSSKAERCKKIESLWKDFGSSSTEDAGTGNLKLRQNLEPPLIALFLKVLTDPDGLSFLLRVRADALAVQKDFAAKNESHEAASLIAEELSLLFSRIFCPGLLSFQEITPDQCSDDLMSYLAEKDTVQPLETGEDFRVSRLGFGRHCFAFFHPALSSWPLIYVQVALTIGGPPGSIPNLLENRISGCEADTAVFFSINATQPGLQGHDLGSHLIKRAISEVKLQYPNVRNLATLSPMPTLRKWLQKNGNPLASLEKPTESERYVVIDAARELLNEGGKCRCPVGNFHQRNGGSIGRINFMADPSEYRLRESFGTMVNYIYDTETIQSNAEKYAVLIQN